MKKGNNKDKEEILKDIDESDLKIKDINIEDLIPNVIDDVILIASKGNQEIHLPDNMPGDKFKRWLKGVGGIFSKDMNRWSKGKKHGKYMILKDTEEKIIVRVIEDNELDAFDFLHLIHGKIKDVPYMILKKVKNGKKLSIYERYIEENKESIDLDPIEIKTNQLSSLPNEDSYSSHDLLNE